MVSNAHEELAFLDLAEAGRLVQTKKVSPVELTRVCLDRIEGVGRESSLPRAIRLITGRNRFATFDNLELTLRLTAVVGTAAIGMTLIIISGGIDLSVGPIIALTTVIIALLL